MSVKRRRRCYTSKVIWRFLGGRLRLELLKFNITLNLMLFVQAEIENGLNGDGYGLGAKNQVVLRSPKVVLYIHHVVNSFL